MDPNGARSIHLCGLGTRPPHDTTLETLQILRECRLVFSDVADRKTRRWLAGYCRGLKRASGAEEIIAQARLGRGPVGLAVWGHPQLTSRLAREIQKKTRGARFEVHTHAAVSPVSGALARQKGFLGDDFGSGGINAYSVETLLRAPRPPDPSIPLVVFDEADGSMLLVSPKPHGSR